MGMGSQLTLFSVKLPAYAVIQFFLMNFATGRKNCKVVSVTLTKTPMDVEYRTQSSMLQSNISPSPTVQPLS